MTQIQIKRGIIFCISLKRSQIPVGGMTCKLRNSDFTWVEQGEFTIFEGQEFAQVYWSSAQTKTVPLENITLEIYDSYRHSVAYILERFAIGVDTTAYERDAAD